MLNWQITNSPNPEDASAVSEGVLAFGRSLSTEGRSSPLACLVREGEVLVAGGVGRTEFARLFVLYLWVAEAKRGQGLGTQVLERMEAEALARGCTDSIIETLNDRSAALYARLGYRTEAVIGHYVGPFNRHTMIKQLRTNATNSDA